MRNVLVYLRWRAALPGLLLACITAGEFATAQLPPAILADRYLVQAERELDSGDPAAAVETLNRIVELEAEHGLEIPDVFWFRRAEAAHTARLHDLAIESVVRYFEISGQEGEHYLAALELYDAAELAKAEAAERAAEVAATLAAAEARRLAAEAAEAERLAAEEAALAAAVAAVAPEMVEIPAGQFRMGCVSGQDCFSDERPVHNVRIRQSFEVSKYEVTFAQWDACVLGGGCGGYRPDDEGWGRGTRPVINVSWEDAQAYVSWLSSQTGEAYRLLSEAEWEYVARAGTQTAYSWGSDIGSDRANCEGCRSRWDDSQTAPVGSFHADAFGVHDMHGNVWEWVEDCWNDSYRRAPSDGSAWLRGNCERRVLRGGSWGSLPRSLRSAERLWNTSGYRGSGLGFRVARTLTR